MNLNLECSQCYPKGGLPGEGGHCFVHLCPSPFPLPFKARLATHEVSFTAICSWPSRGYKFLVAETMPGVTRDPSLPGTVPASAIGALHLGKPLCWANRDGGRTHLSFMLGSQHLSMLTGRRKTLTHTWWLSIDEVSISEHPWHFTTCFLVCFREDSVRGTPM